MARVRHRPRGRSCLQDGLRTACSSSSVSSAPTSSLAALQSQRAEARTFGVMHVDQEGRIIGFLEKPEDPPGMPGIRPSRWRAWASTRSKRASLSPSSNAMPPTPVRPRFRQGHHSVPGEGGESGRSSLRRPASRRPRMAGLLARRRNLDAYFDANIDLTAPMPDLDLYDKDWPIGHTAK